MGGMRGMGAAICAGVLALLVWAAPAGARGPWGPASQVWRGPSGAPVLDVNAIGFAALAWNVDGRVEVFLRAPGGRFRAPTTLGTGAVDRTPPLLAVSDTGDVLVAWVRRHPQEQGSPVTDTQVAIKPAGGDFGPPQTLPIGAESLAIDAAGSAVMVGLVGNEPPNQRVAAVWRAPGASGFTVGHEVSPTAGLNPRVAFAGPQAVATWTGTDPGAPPSALTRTFAAFGTVAGFAPPQRISNPEEDATRGIGKPVVDAGQSGDAAVIWGGGVVGQSVDVAVRRPGGSFTAPRHLGRTGRIEPSVSVSDGGRVIVAWNGFPPDDGPFSSHVAALDPRDDRFEPFELLEVAHAGSGVEFDGLETAVMVGRSDKARGVFSWARLPDGTFGGFDALPITAPVAPAIDFGARHGGLAVWTERGVPTLGSPNRTYMSEYDGRFVAARKPPQVFGLEPLARGVRFILSKTARVRVLVRPPRRSRRGGVAIVSEPGRFGRNRILLPARARRILPRGLVRAVVTARDRSGRRSRPRKITLRIH